MTRQQCDLFCLPRLQNLEVLNVLEHSVVKYDFSLVRTSINTRDLLCLKFYASPVSLIK